MSDCQHDNLRVDTDAEVGANLNEEGDVTIDVICDDCGGTGYVQLFHGTIIDAYDALQIDEKEPV